MSTTGDSTVLNGSDTGSLAGTRAAKPLSPRRTRTADGHEYTILEEVLHALTHGVGAALGIAGLVFLVLKAMGGGATAVAAVTIYSAGLILAFLASTLYHSLSRTRAGHVLEMIDHAMIFVFIAGSYTPFALLTLPPSPGIWLLVGIWTIAIAGIGFKLVTYLTHSHEKLHWVSLGLYLAMGWTVLLVAQTLYELLPAGGFAWLLAGGLCYTVGAGVYAIKGVPFAHTVWHLFVLAGAACHFVTVYDYVLG
ncbi:hemolysin III [Rhodothalassium salexigens DSM 2132]|uniref:Hemolysin III n=1 Tax=Rhodothalassium salexigens DSM 2132 TaxID=1188247 RepID=A0A4R2P7C5_RHOSA|nr:hemolysin III family protein [Rhodothalassium salexigens]MBB4212739.1 hemolysin III [Rhodothalassium salexigens DSM 2132]MBK1639242.1 hypothetical protein [Rhodothalassium salexigens DSM 2132]TCP30158.1 hemolysin III [Rhodothalassium salexigens DSM 2132]